MNYQLLISYWHRSDSVHKNEYDLMNVYKQVFYVIKLFIVILYKIFFFGIHYSGFQRSSINI